ncbi:hypothetical protein [Endozoicomonas sp. OPT23]|nr:hypothetical protein [Endozoicomonas sp. OPT23]
MVKTIMNTSGTLMYDNELVNNTSFANRIHYNNPATSAEWQFLRIA